MTEKSHFIKEKYADLEKGHQILQNQVPKVQKVAHYLRHREPFAKHYSPKFVSIGPIDYDEENLQLGEKYKLLWAKKYLESIHQNAETLYPKFATNIMRLKELFAEDVIKDFLFKFDDEKLSWMLFVDGCSLLQILEKGKHDNLVEMNVNVNQLVLVRQDVLLLENQLPFDVLKLLADPKKNNAGLIECMNDFLRTCHHLAESTDVSRPNASNLGASVEPIHLLDQFRRLLVTENDKKDDKPNGPKNKITHRNIQELKAAGIRFKTTGSRRLKGINFTSGWLRAELKLPEMAVDDTTLPTFLNLIAYEKCPDFKNNNNYEICSFLAFMDSLIDHVDDVKELRSAGVLLNSLGSDEELASLFNTISTDLVYDSERYSPVSRQYKLQIETHRAKWNVWIALGYHTYFSNPWSIIAFLAAVVVLVLTFIQTWYTIKPAGAG